MPGTVETHNHDPTGVPGGTGEDLKARDLGARCDRVAPMVVIGGVVARDVTTLALSFDYRTIDGAEARSLRYLGDPIEEPTRLFCVL